jgi:C-terminal processing protease CtpA/Prc
MKYRNILVITVVALLLSLGGTASVTADEEVAIKAEEAELQAQLEAEYEEAMSLAEKQRLAAEASAKKAREQLQLAAEQDKLSNKASAQARAQRELEMTKMHDELNHTRRQLQETAREIARVNREVARARADHHSADHVVRSSARPIIGVILGNADRKGVEVLGVSPDGPSERAGIKKGDVIVAVDGRKLTSIQPSGDARDGLRIALREIEADKPLKVSVQRETKTLYLTLVPEVREPMSWQSVARFPSAPRAPRVAAAGAPSAPQAPQDPERVISVERIVVPEIDTVEMTMQIEQMRAEIEKRRALRESGVHEAGDGEWEIEFHELSELGNFALQDANIWFGLPMTRGLRLAEVDPDLGEYFKTDRGVLVLKAESDNELKLKSGDVILQVGETEVNSPAEFMRALRDLKSGDELVMDIKRNRKSRTLKTVMPEDRTSFFLPGNDSMHTVTITSSH